MRESSAKVKGTPWERQNLKFSQMRATR